MAEGAPPPVLHTRMPRRVQASMSSEGARPPVSEIIRSAGRRSISAAGNAVRSRIAIRMSKPCSARAASSSLAKAVRKIMQVRDARERVPVGASLGDVLPVVQHRDPRHRRLPASRGSLLPASPEGKPQRLRAGAGAAGGGTSGSFSPRRMSWNSSTTPCM